MELNFNLERVFINHNSQGLEITISVIFKGKRVFIFFCIINKYRKYPSIVRYADKDAI